MADVITKEDLEAQIQADLKAITLDSLGVVKRYIDENTIVSQDKRDELKAEIADSIAQKFDFDAEAEKIDKASNVADALLGLFDTDGNGNLTGEEVLNKLNDIYAQLQETGKLSEDLQNVVKQVTDLKSYADSKIGEVQGAIKTVAGDISGLKDRATQMEADLSTNYFTKDDVKNALAVNKDDILTEVKNLFGYTDSATTDTSNGDGATL